MPRRSKQAFRCPPLKDLIAQLLYAPPDKRREQARRAEKLHDEIDTATNYSLEFVKYRITGYRDEESAHTVMPGEALRPDLRLLIDRLTHSAPLPPEDSEPCESIDELASRLNVSTKTLARWRELGLRWRWMQMDAAAQPRIVVPRSAIEQFHVEHGDRVAHAAKFSQIPEPLKDRIIERARRIARSRQVTPFRIAEHLARRVHRSVETIRLLLEKHDRQHPEAPVFAERVGPLTSEQRREIVHARSMGIPVSVLARRYHKTHSTIRRAIYEQRAQLVGKLEISFIESPTFSRPDAEAVLLRAETLAALDEPQPSAKAGVPVLLDDLPDALRPLFGHAPLTPRDMRSLLTRMHYLRWRAAKVRANLDRCEPRLGELDRIEQDLAQAASLRERLAVRSLPVLLSVARRHLIPLPDQTQSQAVLLRLLELGLPLAIGSVDLFDIRRKQTFDDFVRLRLMRHYASKDAEARIAAASTVSDAADGKPRAKSRHAHAGTGDEALARMRAAAKSLGVSLV